MDGSCCLLTCRFQLLCYMTAYTHTHTFPSFWGNKLERLGARIFFNMVGERRRRQRYQHSRMARTHSLKNHVKKSSLLSSAFQFRRLYAKSSSHPCRGQAPTSTCRPTWINFSKDVLLFMIPLPENKHNACFQKTWWMFYVAKSSFWPCSLLWRIWRNISSRSVCLTMFVTTEISGQLVNETCSFWDKIWSWLKGYSFAKVLLGHELTEAPPILLFW